MGKNHPQPPQTPPPAAPEKATEQPPQTPPAAAPTPPASVQPEAPPAPAPKPPKAPVKIDPANPGQCQVVIPAREKGGKDTLCPGKLVIEQVPNKGRRCTYCTTFYTDEAK